MKSTPMAELVRLPERQAVQRHFDDVNRSALRWLLVVSAPGAVAGVIASLSFGRSLVALLWGFALLLNAVLIFGRRADFVHRWARELLVVYLAIHALAAAFSVPVEEPEPAYVFAGYLFPSGLMLFRMRWLEYVSLAMLFAGTAAWFALGGGFPEGSWIGLLIGIVSYGLVALAICVWLTRKRRNAFLSVWRQEVARDREESRMRGELMDAREIQLSMLPRATPELGWLDAAGFSVPANEVGGDYYEYFRIDRNRLALVIGDVAGHGVASGLVLSGVRSGLHLLRDQLTDPVSVLERLNRMLRETAPKRMFVTLQVALLDFAASTVTVANAGHPPIVLQPAGDSPRFLGQSGLPLGTQLEARYEAVSERVSQGDLLVFYTDGVIESADLEGREFGDERLLHEIERVAADAPSRSIGESILTAVSRFKGDAQQADDVTLVVLRIAASAAAGPTRSTVS